MHVDGQLLSIMYFTTYLLVHGSSNSEEIIFSVLFWL
jgi:hypothetical protein